MEREGESEREIERRVRATERRTVLLKKDSLLTTIEAGYK